MGETTCNYVRENGKRCGTPFGLNKENGRCFFHDPQRAEKRDAARRKGGIAAAAKHFNRRTVTVGDHPGPLETAADARRWADWVTRSVAEGMVSPDVSSEIRGGLREFMKALQAADLEDRVGELTRQIEELRSGKVRSIK